METKYPKICLVGRTNVGKSAIFNRLTDKHTKSLVLDQENVTRDYLKGLVVSDQGAFELVDTGGVELSSKASAMDSLVNKRVNECIEKADLILFVCDSASGLVEKDLCIARKLRQFSDKTLLVLNKADNEQISLDSFGWQKLGFTETFFVSALHGAGFPRLLSEINSRVELGPKPESGFNHDLRISILGKPNVGKSSLLNKLLGEDRSIVSDQAGTTRDAIATHLRLDRRTIELIDTAGLRRKSAIDEDIEKMMTQSSLQAVRKSSLIILVIDGAQAELSRQDLRLLSCAKEQNKSVIFVINKSDLMTEYGREVLDHQLDKYKFMIGTVPTVYISCVDGRGIGKVKRHVNDVIERLEKDISTFDVTEKVQEYLRHRPLYKAGKRLKVFKVRSAPDAKVPTFHLYVCDMKLFGPSEFKCIENVIRKHFDLKGCPVVLSSRQV